MIAAARLALGTAQFGLDYGATNDRGRVPEAEVAAILHRAAEAGIRTLDTSCQYGDAEEVLGRSLSKGHGFDIVTKTEGFGDRVLTAAHGARLVETFERSLRRLRADSVYGLLLHSGDALSREGGGYLLDALETLKARELAARIGVSVYNGAQIDTVLSRFTPDLIQLPASIADQRLVASNHVQQLALAGVEIHVRSLFLQGVLLLPPPCLPAHLASAHPAFEAIAVAATAAGASPLEACLGFGLHRPEFHRLVLGVSSAGEFQAILDAAATAEAKGFDTAGLGIADEAVVNPARWPKRA